MRLHGSEILALQRARLRWQHGWQLAASVYAVWQ